MMKLVGIEKEGKDRLAGEMMIDRPTEEIAIGHHEESMIDLQGEIVIDHQERIEIDHLEDIGIVPQGTIGRDRQNIEEIDLLVGVVIEGLP